MGYYSVANLIRLFFLVSYFCIANIYASDTRSNSQAGSVQLGPRPFYLVNDLDPGALKNDLKKCSKGPFKKTEFSIGHRGAALQFPEHSKESYIAAARMGAGIIECDVTFTRDRQLVCRHSQCDLHATTNILATPLAAKCSVPPDYSSETPFANTRCCSSGLTLAEFKSLTAKMDASDPLAKTLNEFMNVTPRWRTDLYTTKGTLMSHRESIELFQSLGVKMTPELKSPEVSMPFDGDYSQQDFAQQMIDEYKDAGVAAENVFAQSFDLNDIIYWINNDPEYAQQAIYLDGRYDDTNFDHTNPNSWQPSMAQLVDQGVNIIAPPMWMLLTVDSNNKIIPSVYAKAAKSAGLDIISWTLERSGLLQNNGGWYYQTTSSVIDNDGDLYTVLDILAYDVGIKGIFSDWPATVTYYANCKGL